MSRNESASEKAVESTPCVETPTTANASCQSLSHDSFNASAAERESDRPTEKRPSVKSLVSKYGLIEQKSRNARLNNFDVKKKSFTAACERLCSSYKDCVNMEEGDIRRVENVETFVKNHVYSVFNTTTHHPVPPQNQNITETVRFDFKTGISELDKILNNLGDKFWEHIIFMMKVNRDYYGCLTQILDTRKFQSIKDVRLYVSSELKKGDQLGFIEAELTSSFKDHLEKFTKMLDTELDGELPKIKFQSYRTKINVLRNEIEEIKRSTRNAEMNIKLLKKEKKDLMNILENYITENVHKVSLEKRLKSEKEKHVELQAMVTSIFENKKPFCISQIDKSNYSASRSETSNMILKNNSILNDQN